MGRLHLFEGICLKHVQQIADSLELSSIEIDTGTWRYVPPKNKENEQGAQIDLLFDRADGVITLCEVKFCNDLFTVTKSCARELKRKIDVFEKKTGTKKISFPRTNYNLRVEPQHLVQGSHPQRCSSRRSICLSRHSVEIGHITSNLTSRLP